MNLLMLGLGIILHGSFKRFIMPLGIHLRHLGNTIQFPLYFGIMGIMSNSGMMVQIQIFLSPSLMQQLASLYLL